MTFQFLLFPEFRDKAVTLSYDDGLRQDIRLVEIMKKNGLKGTFNLNSGLTDERRVAPEEYQAVYIDNGNELAVHGRKHLSLTSINDARIIEEVFSDRKAHEEALGAIVTGMAYANGSYDDRVVECLKRCGITYARTVVSTEGFALCDDWLRMPATCHHKNPRLFELVDEFLKEEEPVYFWRKGVKLFYLWGHSYEFDYDKNWDIIEKFAEKIGNREDVWYATNGEIYRYVEAFKALEYSADGTRVYNPTAIDVYMRLRSNAKVKISAGQTVAIE